MVQAVSGAQSKTIAPPSEQTTKLRISEIFYSLQGESSRVGLPTVFVRLTGCPLRCVWCDTEYAFSGGSQMTLAQIMTQVEDQECRTVCVTGGEPLAQKGSLDLMVALCDAGYSVSLETSGALDIAPVDQRVSRIVDLKAPGSGEADKNRWQNLEVLSMHDELKFVLASRDDYQWAKDILKTRRLDHICPILFSPVWGQLDATQLAEWILQDRLPVRFQLQMHKLLWGSERGR
jgi:7-carboxy-7-deazaguanine synthase